LTNIFFEWHDAPAVQVLTDSTRLAAALSPLRQRVLAELRTPQSAAGLAPRLGLSRQALNYHLRELEREGFLEVAEERQRRGCVERVMKVTSRSFVVNPAMLGGLAATAAESRDKFSTAYLMTIAAGVVRDVAVLSARARAVDERLATFTMDCEIAFRSPAAFGSFIDDLASAVARLAAHYDQPSARSRRFRLIVGAHPAVTKTHTEVAAEAATHQRAHRRNRARRSS
jgi:DNA-binding transcriptional ArsR family regulator